MMFSLLLAGCHGKDEHKADKKALEQAYSRAADVQKSKTFKTRPAPNIYTNAYGAPPKDVPKNGGYSRIAPTPFNTQIPDEQIKALNKQVLVPKTLSKRLPNKDIPGTPQNAIQKTLIHNGEAENN